MASFVKERDDPELTRRYKKLKRQRRCIAYMKLHGHNKSKKNLTAKWVVKNHEICKEALMEYISQIDVDNYIDTDGKKFLNFLDLKFKNFDFF